MLLVASRPGIRLAPFFDNHNKSRSVPRHAAVIDFLAGKGVFGNDAALQILNSKRIATSNQHFVVSQEIDGEGSLTIRQC